LDFGSLRSIVGALMSKIQEILDLLKRKKCWAVLAGYPNASIIYLHFGAKIRREKIINNDQHQYGLQEYQGEYWLGIYCDWRLQQGNKPITGSCERQFTKAKNYLKMKLLKGEKDYVI